MNGYWSMSVWSTHQHMKMMEIQFNRTHTHRKFYILGLVQGLFNQIWFELLQQELVNVVLIR